MDVSWTIKKAKHRRIDAFELWCWRRLLRVPWTARRSNQSILKEIRPGLFIGRTDAEAEIPILWPPDVKSWLIWEHPDAGKDWRQEEKGMTEDEMLDGITDSVDMSLRNLSNSGYSRSCWWTEKPGMLQFMGLQRVGHNWATELNWYFSIFYEYLKHSRWPRNICYMNKYSVLWQRFKAWTLSC